MHKTLCLPYLFDPVDILWNHLNPVTHQNKKEKMLKEKYSFDAVEDENVRFQIFLFCWLGFKSKRIGLLISDSISLCFY